MLTAEAKRKILMSIYDGLICPQSRQPLTLAGRHLQGQPGTSYPIVNGVPIIIRDAKVTDSRAGISDEVVTELLDALLLPPEYRDELSRIFKTKFVLPEIWMQTEADQFIHRVASSHDGLKLALRSDIESARSPRENNNPAAINVDPLLVLRSYFAITDTQPVAEFSVNIRIRNTGKSIISSTVDTEPVLISYHWYNENDEALEGIRTPLLMDIAPGGELTVPVFFQAPGQEGIYRLEICAVHESLRWLDSNLLQFNVKVSESSTSLADPQWLRTSNLYAYMDDHFEAIRLLKEWSGKYVNNYREHIVEVGGNANPMIQMIDAARRINFDVDPYGMIIGSLISRKSNSGVQYVVADGMDLPLQPGWADVIVMFATFHHFPDPIGLLRHLATLVSTDGLICLMCEPIGHVHRTTMPIEFEQEILKGVNEQSFELWEYAQMFASADLEVVDCQIDIGSIKVALRPMRPVTP